MSYAPEIQPPPITGDAALDQWLKRTADTLNEFIVRTRTPGHGLRFDEADNLEVDMGFMLRNKV